MEPIPTKFKEQKCFYCCKELLFEKWDSHWEQEQHYKNLCCPHCGKKNWFKVNFNGSGHDQLFEPMNSLESVVKKVQER